MEQVSGMAWLTGFADGPPVIPRGPCDPLAGLHALAALLVALEHRTRSGRGQLIEATMVEAALNAAAEIVLEYGAHGVELARDGNRGPVGAPQNLYPCRGDDRWLALAITSDAQWQALAAAMGAPALANDPAFATAAGRRVQHDRIDGQLSVDDSSAAPTCSPNCSWRVAFRPRRCAPRRASAKPATGGARLSRDGRPSSGRRAHLPSSPLRFGTDASSWSTRHAPALGQHTEEILRELLGLDDAELAQLRADAIIGDRPVACSPVANAWRARSVGACWRPDQAPLLKTAPSGSAASGSGALHMACDVRNER
jgi:crotonobetainyl-CoA:carnitine CoA-transferase CaiB-like acyl-CoA transferase